MKLWEKMQVSIYTFYLEADKEGPLRGWKKVLHEGAGLFTLIDAGSWYVWSLMKAKIRRFFAFMIGQ